MRLSIQGYLILLLGCFFSVSAFAGFGTSRNGPFPHSSAFLACKSIFSSASEAYTDILFHEALDDLTVHVCIALNGSGRYLGEIPIYEQVDEDVCEPPNVIDPWTNECIAPESREECWERGELYSDDYKMCVPQCEGMVLDGYCLSPYDEEEGEDGCNPESDGFVGSYGSGNKQTHVCAPASQECKASGGTFGIVNGKTTCLPPDYGAPQCKSGSVHDVLVNDGYGFVCETVGDPDADQEPPEEPEPNTDTDGDGIPDEYQRENDPDAGNKQRDEMLEGQREGNEKLDGIGDRLDKLGEIGKEGNQYLDDIEDGIGGINSKLDDISGKLDGPEGGYNTDGKGSAPGFGETAGRLRQLIVDNPTINAVTTVPTIASNNSCPVYTIPGNEYFGPLTMSVHCEILNDYRGQLGALFMAFWSLAAVMVFLRA